MIAPDDFGMTWEQTLSHVSSAKRDRNHTSFWQAWAHAVSDHHAMLEALRNTDDPSDPTATHVFQGVGHASIGCRLEMPARPTGGVVILHGYADVPTLAESIERRSPMLDRGLAVLAIRVRGYPGSRASVGDITAYEHGWICHGLAEIEVDTHKPTDWVLSDAVADTLFAVAALRRLLPADATVSLLGQSFGGGIATIAAAQAANLGTTHPDVRIDRLALGVPTFGDWPWRIGHTHPRSPGSGGEVKRFLIANHGPDNDIIRSLNLFDAAVHARCIQCPTICKLAMQDDIVPAPTQHAVYNALGTPPGLKSRFLTPFGHFDGGITDARRHALFDRLATDFCDPAREPMNTITAWRDCLLVGSREPSP